MTVNDDGYELGKDVTASAESKEKKGSVVLSVRLSTDEMVRLEQLARAYGKNVSQLVREALAQMGNQAHHSFNYSLVVSQDGTLLRLGGFAASQPIHAETVPGEREKVHV